MSQQTHRWRRSLAILLALTLGAAACGSDSEDAAPDTTAAPATTVAPATTAAPAATIAEVANISDECPIPEPAESVTIDLIGWEFPVTAEIGNEFADCNTGNLQINVQLLDSASAQDQINLDLATGSPEFEILHATDSLVGQWADDLTDLTPFVEKYRDEFDLDDISQAMWDGATVDGKMLGVPLFSNTMHFFYNSEIFTANGIAPPDTYDDVIAACGVLRDAGFDDAFNINLGAGWAWEIEFSNLLKSLGGNVLNDDNGPGWNTSEGLAAVNKIVEISDACMTDAGRSYSIDDAEAALRAGELPMATIWASRASQMDDPENSLVVDLIEFLPAIKTTPDSLRNGPAFVDYYSIPAGGSVDPEQVFLVIMAAIDHESQNAAAAHAAVARLSATNPDAPRNGEASAISVAEGVGARSKNPALGIAQGVLGSALLEITASGADPAQALASAEAAYIQEATDAGFLSGGAEVANISDECPIPEPAESVTIDLIGWEFPVTAEIGNEFADCNTGNLQINVQLLDSASAQDQINLDLATGSPEFEILHATDSLVGQWADDLTDLTPFVEKYRDEFDLDDISQAMWDGATVDGKMLGVPLFSNTMHFFYNSEIFTANGIAPPDTYDDVIAACGVLRDAGFDDAFNINLGAGWAWEIEFSNLLKSLGGNVLNDDNGPGWNTSEGLAAVNKIVEISDACMTDAGRSYSIDDAEAALRAGELPMATIWASRASQMDDPENSLVVDLIEFLPAIKTTPDSLRNGPAFVDYYSIPAGGSVDPEQVFLVIMAAIDHESQNAAAAHAAVARLSATNPDAPRNGEASAISVAEGVGARSKNPALGIAQGVLGSALLEITASGADPAQALASAEAAYIQEATDAGFLSGG